MLLNYDQELNKLNRKWWIEFEVVKQTSLNMFQLQVMSTVTVTLCCEMNLLITKVGKEYSTFSINSMQRKMQNSQKGAASLLG